MKEGLLSLYLARNDSFESPFLFKLTDRGFYSEVNGLLDAVIYGLAKRRRLIVDDGAFGDQRWSDFFTSTLPTAPKEITETIPPAWIINGAESEYFGLILSFARQRHLPLWFPSLGLFGGVRHVKRAVARMLTTPLHAAVVPSGLSQPYAAFHIRRGDKTEGYYVGSNLIREGEAGSPEIYLAMLKRKSPRIRTIFVMTDDYTAVEELRNAADGYNIITLCRPQERGYRQTAFMSQTSDDKGEKLQRLLVETQIAVASDIFIGGFKSNVARFIVTRHIRPDRCYSVDAKKTWHRN